MRKTLQQIEDSYISLGYKGEKLRRILDSDKEYQSLLKQRRGKLSQHFKVSKSEKKRYVLSTDSDFEILAKCKEIEELNLIDEDRKLVSLIKSQLENDWRNPLASMLNQLLEKYT